MIILKNIHLAVVLYGKNYLRSRHYIQQRLAEWTAHK